MRVTVDQTWRDDFALRADSLPRRVVALDVCTRANGNDTALRDCDSAVVNHPALLVHRYDGSTQDQHIDPFRP